MQRMIFGRQVGCSESGRGRPLVLIHGYPFDRTEWDPQLEGLADLARVIAPDLWGFGESAALAETNVGSYADLVHDLLDELGLSQAAVLCGLSMGGYIVFEYLRRYPERVAGVILCNTKAGPDSPEGKAGRDKSAAVAREQGAPAIAAQLLPKLLSPRTYETNPQLVETLRAMMSRQSVEGIVGALGAMRDRPDSTPTLETVAQPALVIGGADDQLFPRTEFEKIAGGLPNARLEILAEAGHVSNMEQPELFNLAVRDFWQTV